MGYLRLGDTGLLGRQCNRLAASLAQLLSSKRLTLAWGRIVWFVGLCLNLKSLMFGGATMSLPNHGLRSPVEQTQHGPFWLR